MITANILFNDEISHLQNCIESLGYQKTISCIQIITTSGIGKYYEYAKSIIRRAKTLHMFANTSFRIVPYLFNNDFSKVRNFANSICQTDYILHLDCDERIVIPNNYDFFDNLNTFDKDLFLCKIFGWHTHINKTSAFYNYDGARLMKKHVKWVNEVHEVPEVPDERILKARTFRIAHLGYDISKIEMMEKIERNITLLNKANSMPKAIREKYLNLTANILKY